MPRIERKYDPEQLKAYGFRTLAVIVLGDSTYLLKQNQDGILTVEYVDGSTQRDYFLKETARLSGNNQIEIPGVDASQIEICQLDLNSDIEAKLAERTSGPDEIALKLSLRDGVSFEGLTVDLSQDELLDLFLPDGKTARTATFFQIDTTEQEVVGIALRRTNPRIILIPAVVEPRGMSTLGGLQRLVQAIYSRLIENATTLQAEVDNLVFEATLPTNRQIVFAAEATSAKQVDLHKKLFQIRTLLASRFADQSTGLNDKRLQALLPFLIPKETKSQGMFGGLLRQKQVTKPQTMTVDASIWESLVEVVGPGFINTHSSGSRRTERPQDRHTTQTSTSTEAKVSNLEAVRKLIMPIEAQLESGLKLFEGANVAELGLRQLVEFDKTLEALQQSIRSYRRERNVERLNSRVLESRITAQSGRIKLAQVPDEVVFGFITGADLVVDYKDKIAAVRQAIDTLVIPIFKATGSRTERLLSEITRNSNFALSHPDIKNTLIPQVIKLVRLCSQKDGYCGELSLITLSLQILYILWARVQEVRKNGSYFDFDELVGVGDDIVGKLRLCVSIALKR